jgi:hypothetical protein
MNSTHVLWLYKLLSRVLIILVFAVVLAACVTHSNGTTTRSPHTLSTIPTYSTIPGYGKLYGCPSDVLVSSAPPTPTVTLVPEQDSTVFTAHEGDVVEIQMPFGVAWNGPTTSQGALQLQQPAGYVWQSSKACIWRFVAIHTGTAMLDFSGSAICKKVSLCVPSVDEAIFTLHVD